MKKRYRLNEKEKLLNEFEKSGLKQSAFSKEHDLNAKTLSRWVNDRLKEGAEGNLCKKSPPLFIPILIQEDAENLHSQVSSNQKEDLYLTLKTKGFALDIPASVDASSTLIFKIIKMLHAL